MHLRDLHKLNRDFPELEGPELFREMHFQRLEEIEVDDTEPVLLLHLFPESKDTGERLIDVTEIEQLPVPAVRREEFRLDRMLEYPEAYWNRVTARFGNHQEQSSETVLYDTGFFETVGNGLCYSLESSAQVGYAISSQDLEQSLIATVQFYHELLPSDNGKRVYVILSGMNMDNTTLDQYRRVDRSEPLSEADLTSRLTPVDFASGETLRDQVSPVLRPFWYSQTLHNPDTYYSDDGEWKFANDIN